MQAVTAHAGSDQVHLDTVPIPEPGPQDVLVRVAAAGLAPGMLALLARGAFRHLPTVLGHEAAGTVAVAGPEAQAHGWTPGQRIRVHPQLNCRTCAACTSDRDMLCAQQAMIGHAAFGPAPMPLYARYHDGGLAEYLRVPHWLLDPLPDNVSFDLGAKIHDLANALRALKTAALRPGSTVIVTAATGTMGTATVKLAPHFGIGRLILVARSRERLDAVRRLAGSLPTDTVALEELGTDWATTSGLTTRLRHLLPQGADAVIDYTPDGPATWQATAALATGATMVHMGGNPTPPPFPAITLMANCWRLIGTRACTRSDVHEILRLLETSLLHAEDLITHRSPLTEARTALHLLRTRTEPLWMAVINP
ncbi:alcohol dehydrogenase catalytic domain-containing protein [Streptomyces sp. LP05-1]|uniref:2-deoxy-scyllo-inosamine dehydrogenase n=1 Tax=Streptomyces pyxinae TaxID=2970734 RepID=A0ABT2CD84_9ACTN|nr:alcohol dehydrogenase catalytic domain-containing protein [Streptomyces sp. LP05-1]MCS0634726.1 alcohol dehydrogenase catalytic domain-containing protein [Streptomyces sp. LP05-1]